MILAINTSSTLFSVALMKRNGAVISQYSIFSGAKGARPLVPALHELLMQSRLDLRKARAVAVASGPGSFTGLRVGLSLAKGISHGLGIPLIGVPTLEALASQVSYPAYPVCPIIGSLRGEVFAGLFRPDEKGEMVRLGDDGCVKISELAFYAQERTLFIGDDFESQAPLVQKAAGRNALLVPSSFWAPRAEPVGTLALRRLEKGESDDLEGYSPTYLRPPEVGISPSGPETPR